MAKLIKIDRNGSKHWEGMITCDRCNGRGWFATGVCNGELVPARPDNAVCYKCLGAGKVYGKWIERTPEYQAKLDARRKAKAEALAAEYEKQRKELEAKAEAERLAKEAEKARIKAQKAISQYVGQIGERITTTATFDHSAYFEVNSFRGFGTDTIYIHTFKDAAGNVLIWKTSKGLGCMGLQDGDQVQITGTVKEHKEYKDEKQTALTRCKITKKEG